MTRSATSRYARSTLREDGLQPMLVFAEIPDHENDRIHRIQPGEEGRLDHVAKLHYGDSELAWVIALASGVKHVQRDVTLGRRLRVPARETVRRLTSGELRG